MRLVFTKLQTPLKNILVDIGNGKYEQFEVNSLKESSSAKYIQLPDTISANLIRIKTNSTELDSFNMIKDYMITDNDGNVLGSWSLTAGTSTGVLTANETRYNYGLLDKYKPVEESSNYHIILSDTASYTFNASSEANAYLENNNGQRYEFENSQKTSLMMSMFSITHNNIFYVVVPTLDEDENVISAELRKINLNNMQVEYSIDVSEYFDVNMENFGTLITWLPSMCGNILSDDKPVLPIAGTDQYFDLTTGTLSTSDLDFTAGNVYYLSKINTWYKLDGNTSNTGIWATNNKYSSIEDTAEINEPYLEGNIYITDAPAFSIGNGTFRWISNGVQNELALNGNKAVYRDENDNKIFITPGSLMFNGVNYETNLQNNFGYVVNEYVSEIPYYVEKVKIDKTRADFTDVPITAETVTINGKATIEDIETSTVDAEAVKTIDAEIDGKKFYKGKLYDKIVGTTKELIDYILDTTNKKYDEPYSILYTGSSINFNAQNMPNTEIPNAQVIGEYLVYSADKDDVSVLNFGDVNFDDSDYDPFTVGYHLLKKMHFYGFLTNFDARNNKFSSMTSGISNVHVNNCTFYYRNRTGAAVSDTVYLNKCNNVSFIAIGIKWPATATVDLNNCKDVRVQDLALDTSRKVNIKMRKCNDCYVAVGSLASSVLFVQKGGGNNLVVHYPTQTEGKKIEPTYQTFNSN